ncbi:DNA mismatch repair protein MutL [Anoxybacter fermentans]|uniref:DNA mismatch repair protein MutL n=1 Tax=Anoxybacter fermentans TaxID=1323375 RepID=A0A3Q9HRV2_9FIRM|nr:GlmL-related ornithine degradation protein [Anoxybacter fermentans]AZR74332.1 DNA mismatch repair protein MutL [Anoxybacter fermentans]
MKVDVLVAEIGSTTTVVNAFTDLHTPDPIFLGQGQAPTTVLEGDVTIGLNNAIEDLKANLGVLELTWGEMHATSSAAGGLKMTVHGLVYDMTVKAAREAALGAGGVIREVTAGRIKERHLKKILKINPNIILLAGGVDYGEEEVILDNAEMLAKLELDVPVIYAGNKAIQEDVKEILEDGGKKVFIVDNVYPNIDEFNILPTRRVIQQVFEEHIVRAPGMSKIKDLIDGPMMPTPGAVMEAAQLLYDHIGDLMVLDVGGATTDVHSVTEGSGEIRDIMISPEPTAKRTVEGDLGVFVNAINLIELIGKEEVEKELGVELDQLLEERKPIPRTKEEIELIQILTREAVNIAVDRHVGQMKDLYGPTGRVKVAEGKDLTRVKWIIGTGGALTRLKAGPEILGNLRRDRGKKLLPPLDAEVLIDHDYIMASMGVMSKRFPEAALKLMLKSMKY